MIKYWFVFFYILIKSTALCGQQSPRTFFNPLNWQFSNPASLDRWFFKKKTNPSCMWTIGSKFDGIGGDGAPLTCFVSGEALASPNFHWGGELFYDKTDAISAAEGSLMFKYIGRTSQSNKGLVWSIGIQPRFFYYSIAVDRLTPEQLTDPLLSAYQRPKFKFEAGSGFFIREKTKWYAGVSSLNLIALTKRIAGLKLSPEMTPQVNGVWGFYKYGEESILEVFWGANAVRKLSFYTTGSRFRASVNGGFRFYPNGRSEKSDIWKYWFGGGLGTNGLLSGEGGLERICYDKDLPLYRVGISLSFPAWYSKVLFGPNPSGLEIIMSIPVRGRTDKDCKIFKQNI